MELRSSWLRGAFTWIFIRSCLQDYKGKEAYIKSAQEGWVEAPLSFAYLTRELSHVEISGPAIKPTVDG